MNTYVYASVDGGNNFRSIGEGIPKGHTVASMSEDPSNPNVLYSGTEFGLFVSPDRGGKWTRFKGNLPTVPVYEIVFHPRDNDMILATHGRSIWILDDATPLRQYPEAIKTDAFLFDMRPATQFNPANDRGFVTDKPFFGKNPTYGAPISFYLAKSQTDVALRIRDAAGNQVREITGNDMRDARGAGVNRVYWDLRHQPLAPLAGQQPQGGGGGGGGFGGGGGAGAAGTPPYGNGGTGGFGGGGGGSSVVGGSGGFGGGNGGTAGGGGGAGLGGAIFNHNGTLTISNSTFANNAVYGGFDAGGGGNGVALGSAIFNLQGGVAIQDSTLALNITAGANAGGAVYDLGYLRNDDGGKWYLQSNIDIQNSILANSSDLSGPSSDLVTNAPSTLTGGAANIATSTVTLDSTDITVTRNAFGNGSFNTSAGMPIAADPQLGPLQYNGGPTPTMAPSSGSPAIDNGSTIATVDQRGCPRPVGLAPDIGAYETSFVADLVFRDGLDGNPSCP